MFEKFTEKARQIILQAREEAIELGHIGKGRKGVYGLGSLWRIVWCMEIGVIGVVKVI